MMASPSSTSATHAASPVVGLLRAEFARAFQIRHAVVLAVLSVMGLGLAFWLPAFPDSVRQFFARVFQLPGWPEIVVANGLTGILFFVFWVGAFDVFTITVVPREERTLDLYLAKPLSRRQYMLGRLIPIMATITGLGIVAAVVLWMALASAGLGFPLPAYIGASAIVIAWTVCLVAITNVAVLFVHETYSAALTAFAVMMVALLPDSIYMYRPDVFAGAPLLRSLIVFPLTLMWNLDFTASWGFGLAGLLVIVALGLTAASGWLIEARDVG